MLKRVPIATCVVLALVGASAFVSADGGVMPSDGGRADAASDAAIGRLPPTVIQQIVRAHFGVFKLCYTKGLRGNPNLAGHVTIQFVIDRTGHVSQAIDDPTSDLPDANVRKCIVDSFFTLEFPPPEGGVVRVGYPLIFKAGDGDAATDAGARDAARSP